MSEANGALIVGTLLQAVFRAETTHEERPATIAIRLRGDISDAMLSNHPNRMAQVFDNTYNAGAIEAAVHVEQRLPTVLLVEHAAARHRALPDESATILHHTDGGGSRRGLAWYLGNGDVHDTPADRIDQ